MAKEMIEIDYVATRPYNRLYVGFKVRNNEVKPSCVTTHFDGQFGNQWHKAIAYLIKHYLLLEHPQYDYIYHDDEGKKDLLFNTAMCLEEIEILLKNNYNGKD